MISFKEQVKTDLDVFISMEEFAETHNINGEDIVCVLQGLTTKEQITQANNTPAFDGISGISRVLHIKSTDLAEPVIQGNVMEVDGEMFRIGEVVEDMGLTTINLEVDRL